MNFMSFHILGIIIPTDFHIFQRGRYTTNQDKQCHKPSIWEWFIPPIYLFLVIWGVKIWNSSNGGFIGKMNEDFWSWPPVVMAWWLGLGEYSRKGRKFQLFSSRMCALLARRQGGCTLGSKWTAIFKLLNYFHSARYNGNIWEYNGNWSPNW